MQEAALRSTTTYLVQRRIDMLPKALTEEICSLKGEVERLAFSVIWKITKVRRRIPPLRPAFPRDKRRRGRI